MNSDNPMSNQVVITASPVVLGNRKLRKDEATLRIMLATQDLYVAKESIERKLTHSIPVLFNFDLYLNLSISTTSFKIKIDYSKVPDAKSRKLIKLYLAGEMELFAREWFKIGA